jgi:uncharacterized hydrophobic protein (TIGR00271 family)
MNNLLDNFRLQSEKEDYGSVIETIEKGVVFKGTNLWILVFAIFIASLGLNVNSTAVIIGAMLVSPLMGPIMGLGLGMAINDLALLRKSIYNYLFAAGVGLATSTIFFLLSPINDAHSEILARTAPNIYDVLIALFGGLAGILATSSKQKGNVIPGVAIATALMPPLCTAGFGLATLQFEYFFGAFYLFFINTVFIAFATIITTRFLKFPYKQLPEKKDEQKAKRIIWSVVVITLLPSLYFGYDIVQQNKFNQQAAAFIENEAVFPNDYLLQKNIDAKHKAITLTYGGEIIDEKEIELLKSKLPQYNLQNAALDIRQGFAYLNEDENNQQTNQLTLALVEKEKEIRLFKSRLDSLDNQKNLGNRICEELKVQYPSIQSCIVQKAFTGSDSLQINTWIAIIKAKKSLIKNDRDKIEKWMKVRIETNNLKIYFEE